MTWPKKHNLPAHLPTYLPTCLPPIENTIRSDPRDLWLLRYLSRVLRTHDLTQKNLPTYLPTYLHNYSPTYLPCDTRQSCRLVTIETLITILTIENLNSWQSLLPDNQEWQWTAFAILAMFTHTKNWRKKHPQNTQTSQELRMLSSVTLDCQVTKIVMNSGSQL